MLKEYTGGTLTTEREIDMNDELRTYEDVEACYLALGWGCKCCGRLNSASWWKDDKGGDTYCGGCEHHIRTGPVAEPFKDEPRATFTQYPRGTRTAEFSYDADSQGFEVAAHLRQEHERIYGYLPRYV